MRFSPPRRFASLVLTLFTACSALCAEPFRFPVSVRAEASTTWADNISRTSNPPNRRDAALYAASVTASNLTPLASGVSFITEAAAGYEDVPRFPLNNAATLAARGTLRWKFGLGAYVPVLSATASLTRREARLAGDTGWLAGAALTFSRRFNESWRASLTGDWSQHYAAHSAFDVRYHRLLGSLSCDLNETWQLTAGGGRRWGDITANASGAVWASALGGLISPAVTAYYPTVPWETNGAWGPNWVSYRVTARSDFWWLELTPALGPNTSLPLRYESSRTVNRIGIVYPQELWTLSLLHRF